MTNENAPEKPKPPMREAKPPPPIVATILKVIVYLFAGALVLAVLVFGTCLLIFRS